MPTINSTSSNAGTGTLTATLPGSAATRSLSAVPYSTSTPVIGSSGTFTNGIAARQTMITSAAGVTGTGNVIVGLQVSLDAVTWQLVGTVSLDPSNGYSGVVANGSPACYGRAVLIGVASGILSGTVTATVAGA